MSDGIKVSGQFGGLKSVTITLPVRAARQLRMMLNGAYVEGTYSADLFEALDELLAAHEPKDDINE